MELPSFCPEITKSDEWRQFGSYFIDEITKNIAKNNMQTDTLSTVMASHTFQGKSGIIFVFLFFVCVFFCAPYFWKNKEKKIQMHARKNIHSNKMYDMCKNKTKKK